MPIAGSYVIRLSATELSGGIGLIGQAIVREQSGGIEIDIEFPQACLSGGDNDAEGCLLRQHGKRGETPWVEVGTSNSLRMRVQPDAAGRWIGTWAWPSRDGRILQGRATWDPTR